MMYAFAIFTPPIYFLIKKRWGAFALTMALLLASIFLLFTVWLSPLILILWALSASLAVWDIRQNVVKQN
jgi:hypothetical protein